MAKDFVAIIDYGSGNLRSAAKAFGHVIAQGQMGMDVKITSDPDDVLRAARIVLPGQGAFGNCIKGLNALPGMRAALEKTVLQQKKPFLGICVGMQLMADRGLEHGEHEGLGWIGGQVVPMAPANPALKIPHMGWNEARPAESAHFVLRNTDSSDTRGAHYYFVHSFVFECKDRNHVLAQTDYGGNFSAAVGRDNMIGVQFHPEKSQQAGLKLLSQFLQWET